tara:strand:+ start:1732 stop:2433 length:702 start_codon:yes stop_codon:yes gene_type:complete
VTEKLFIENSYTKSESSVVRESYQNEVILDKTIFYPIGGGQPSDTGTFRWGNKEAKIVNSYSNQDNSVVHIVNEGDPIPILGESIDISIDWKKRYLHMRMHTGLHLLGSILKYGVTGGNISAQKSRLDFDMEDPVDKEYVNTELEKLVDADHPISSSWITQEELRNNPEIIRTMSVKPPSNAKKIRLVKIGNIDLQPCGGTHVNSTAEVGKIRVKKVEKKGKRNRRVSIELVD